MYLVYCSNHYAHLVCVTNVTFLLYMQRLCTPHNVNCRDMRGRYSTPLHFAAGFNRVSSVEYLLQNGADVHARDKGLVTM